MIDLRRIARGGFSGGARWVLGRAQDAFGVALIRSRDRVLLEDVVLPWYAERDEFERVLFVGCDWQTPRYARQFFGRDFATIDIVPDRARYGGPTHIVGALEDLDRYLAPGTLDLVICTGVYGWGLDERAACERAFDHCYTRLRPGGHLVLGWNDAPGYDPCRIDLVESLRRFKRTIFPPLGTARRRTGPNGHTYAFLMRPEAAAAPGAPA